MLTDNSLIHTMIANERQKTTEIHSDVLLQASRRVDWRFLLPGPNLGQVAYLGPARGMLLESLRLFSTSLVVVEAGDAAPLTQHDVVVVSNPTTAALRQAVELLKPGGWLYMEGYGPFSHRGLRCLFGRPCLARDYIMALRRLGIMDEVEAHWHWPDFESCTKIIPLGDSAAFLHLLVRHSGNKGAQLKSALGRWLLWSGLLSFVIPCFSIVAHRTELQMNSHDEP